MAKYRTSVHMGTKPNGKRWVQPVEADTKAELALKKAELIAQRDAKLAAKDAQTFGHYLDLYLETKRHEVNERYYQTGIKAYAAKLDSIRDIPINEVSAKDVQDILDAIAEVNPTTGEPASANVLRGVRRCVREAFKEAGKPLDKGARVVTYNLDDYLRTPKAREPVKREPISEEQIDWIKDTPHECQTAAMIMLFANLRRGEVTALTADKVDLKAKTIRVNGTCEWAKGSRPRYRDTTKTEAGDRTVTMPDVLVNYLNGIDLKGHRYFVTQTDTLVKEDWWADKWADYMSTLDLKYASKNRQLKATGNRKPKDGHVVRSKYDPFKQGKAIKTFTPHMLRHTCCTLYYSAGIPVERAAYLMGHSKPTTTLKIYTHLERTHFTRDIERLNELLGGGLS